MYIHICIYTYICIYIYIYIFRAAQSKHFPELLARERLGTGAKRGARTGARRGARGPRLTERGSL